MDEDPIQVESGECYMASLGGGESILLYVDDNVNQQVQTESGESYVAPLGGGESSFAWG